MTPKISLGEAPLSWEDVVRGARDGQLGWEYSPQALQKMERARQFVLELCQKKDPVYGINTGFGALADTLIDSKNLAKLQVNLVRSHCTGVGPPLGRQVVRGIMILRANCLAQGHSGISLAPAQRLLDFLNFDITPIVPEKGSVGASGDLAPLAHIALAVIGEGSVWYQGQQMPSSQAQALIGRPPVELGAKDGLALINGTGAMLSLGCLALEEAFKLAKLADVASCLTLDGLMGSSRAYSPLIGRLRPYQGHQDVVFNLGHLLEGSEILRSHADCGKVQDPYSLRCVPQVHGACRQTFLHAQEIFSTEIQSVTDNPLIFPEESEVLSGGNFHGQALALALDYMALGVSELASISERRIEKMMNPHFSELPSFLSQDSGLNSGLMIAHVTAAALVSENKILSHPASVDSIPTSTDKEDHVSMGMAAGRKLHTIVAHTKDVLAIELLAASQAVEFRRPLKSSPLLEEVLSVIRSRIPPIEEDRVFGEDIQKMRELIDSGEILPQDLR